MFFPEYPFTTVCLHTTHTLVHWANKYLCYLDKLITLSLSKFTICYKCKRAQIPNFTFAIISTHCYTVRAFKFFFWQKKILPAPRLGKWIPVTTMLHVSSTHWFSHHKTLQNLIIMQCLRSKLSNTILGSFTYQLVIERKGIPSHTKLCFKYCSSRFDPG